jgi:hypothetical protein
MCVNIFSKFSPVLTCRLCASGFNQTFVGIYISSAPLRIVSNPTLPDFVMLINIFLRLTYKARGSWICNFFSSYLLVSSSQILMLSSVSGIYKLYVLCIKSVCFSLDISHFLYFTFGIKLTNFSSIWFVKKSLLAACNSRPASCITHYWRSEKAECMNTEYVT